MHLHIDTSIAGSITLELNGERFEQRSERDKSQKLIPLIQQILTEKGKSITDVSEISLFTGPGSYTGLRVGAAVAQMLSWGLKIKLNGKPVDADSLIKLTYQS